MNFFNKLQSMGGNYVSRLGGADILTQDQLQSLSPTRISKFITNKKKQQKPLVCVS
jgi:hypothetical protein